MFNKGFILANPRSGSSMLRLMLNSHSRIVAPPESGFLHWWFHKYADWNRGSNTYINVDSFISDLSTSRKIETWNLNYVELKNRILAQMPDSYGELIALVYLEFARRKGKQPAAIVDKNNYYISHLTELAEIWKDAKYVLLVRDGRDVACSYKTLKFLRTTSIYRPDLTDRITEIAREWTENNERVLGFFANLPSSSAIIVRYEDLLRSPNTQLNRLSQFFGLSFDEQMLLFYDRNQKDQDEPEETIDWKRKTLEKPDVSNIGKFRVELTPQELEQFCDVAAPLLLRFGYSV